MEGVAKVIDELGLMILAKNVELEQKQNEIDKLKTKIEAIECYIDALEGYIDADKKRLTKCSHSG